MSFASEDLDGFLKGPAFDDRYGHVLIRYDQQAVTLRSLKETIRETGAEILVTRKVSKGPGTERTVLMKLSNEDVRLVILRLTRHQLIEVEGYNGKKQVSAGEKEELS
jgi:hypothetical protein